MTCDKKLNILILELDKELKGQTVIEKNKITNNEIQNKNKSKIREYE